MKSYTAKLTLLCAAWLLSCTVQAHSLQNKLYETGEPIPKPRVMTGFIEMQHARGVPEVPFVDEAGQTHTLKQYQGKLTLVNLWATWCTPCLREIPELQKLQQQYADKNIAIVPISIDEEVTEVRPFLNQHGFSNYSTWLDPDKNIEQIIPANVVPATYAFDAKGNLVGFVRGYLDWTDKDVAPYLDKLIAKYAQ
ncbi:TlpA disulfide reductase family protein [Shewanella mangrovisoli]|uniref:TlpA family protein disulfide reductase n=1 Tax=Shewanella mangrovisoli TaxID=2864211 RepID=A0ABV4VM84_9GAMM